MKKLLLLSTLFLALSCSGDNEEFLEEVAINFLEKNDGKGFSYQDGNRDHFIFFYDSDIFLKEAYREYNPDGSYDSFCLTTKEGSNTDNGQNFTAEILKNVQGALDVRITYSGDEGNTTVKNYEYRQVCDTTDCLEYSIGVTDGLRSSENIFEYETTRTHNDLCN